MDQTPKDKDKKKRNSGKNTPDFKISIDKDNISSPSSDNEINSPSRTSTDPARKSMDKKIHSKKDSKTPDDGEKPFRNKSKKPKDPKSPTEEDKRLNYTKSNSEKKIYRSKKDVKDGEDGLEESKRNSTKKHKSLKKDENENGVSIKEDGEKSNLRKSGKKKNQSEAQSTTPGKPKTPGKEHSSRKSGEVDLTSPKLSHSNPRFNKVKKDINKSGKAQNIDPLPPLPGSPRKKKKRTKSI